MAFAPGDWKIPNPDRIFIVELGAQRIATGAHFNARYIAQAHQRAILRGFQDNIAKLLQYADDP